jgi:hypothetical protein
MSNWSLTVLLPPLWLPVQEITVSLQKLGFRLGRNYLNQITVLKKTDTTITICAMGRVS